MKDWTTDFFEYGKLDNNLVNIKDVANGIKCNCKCPECDERLIAVNRIKGEKPRPHFRHYSNINCDPKAYQETVIHYLAKQLIESKGYITLPKISFLLSDEYRKYLTEIDPEISTYQYKGYPYINKKIEPYKLKFQEIIIEKKDKQIKPDIQIIIDKKTLIIEIAYTHQVDEKKLLKIRNNNIDGIEINLSDLQKHSTPELIEKAIYSEFNDRIIWLNNEKINALLKNRKKQALEVRQYIWENSINIKTYSNMKRVYCPINRIEKKEETVLIERVCKTCDYFIDIIPVTNHDKEFFEMEKKELQELGKDTSHLVEKYGNKIYYKAGFVLCIWHKRRDLENLIKASNKKAL
jgi:hypothetical protein